MVCGLGHRHAGARGRRARGRRWRASVETTVGPGAVSPAGRDSGPGRRAAAWPAATGKGEPQIVARLRPKPMRRFGQRW